MSKSLTIQGYPLNNLAQHVGATIIQQAKKGVKPQRKTIKIG
jgi:hypothetical protein